LQWLLTHSFHAKLLAVKRVTSNQGKKTPGIDGILWKGNKAKMQAVISLKRHGYSPQPLRRIYIPKKNGKKRPLSIPTMFDRAMQALHKLALSPVARNHGGQEFIRIQGKAEVVRMQYRPPFIFFPNQIQQLTFLKLTLTVVLTILPKSGCWIIFLLIKSFFRSG
jgi:N-terminal domain of reverse transcriptase